MQNTDSFVDNVMKVITVMIFVSFVNRFILVPRIQMMMINGLDVTRVADG